jgi:predicted metal-dependent hydrolase
VQPCALSALSCTFDIPALVAQGIEHRFPKPGVGGSSPPGGTPFEGNRVSVPNPLYGLDMTELPIRVVRSGRRKRTVQASLKEGHLEVRVPAGLEPEEESRLVTQIAEKVTRKITSAGVDLDARARHLAKKYGLPKPASVEWSSRQMRRWGSSTAADGRIRISNRLARMPEWVLDSVIVHELAHLTEPNHGPRFQALVSRYELAERAHGYLIAMSEGRGGVESAYEPTRPAKR